MNKTFIGKSCRSCGKQERYKSTGRCVDCKRRQSKKSQQTVKGKAAIKRYKQKSLLSKPWQYKFHRTKERCKQKGIPFTVTKEDIEKAWPKDGLCPALGIKLHQGLGGIIGSPNLANIDRLIPELGYVPGNIVVISQQANLIKTNEINPDNIRRVAEWLERELRKRQG